MGNGKNNRRILFPFLLHLFTEKDKLILDKNISSPYKFLFVGTLNEGKRPFFTIQVNRISFKEKNSCYFKNYGNGDMKKH